MVASQTPKQSLFVVQRHQTPHGVHWDLMIQQRDVLWTWRMDRQPSRIGDTPLTLEKIADHPLRFLTYEGPVQHHTGNVRIVDSGWVSLTEKTDGELVLVFDGVCLHGSRRLIRGDGAFWTLTGDWKG